MSLRHELRAWLAEQVRLQTALVLAFTVLLAGCTSSDRSEREAGSSAAASSLGRQGTASDSVAPLPSDDAWRLYEEFGDRDRSKLTHAQQAVLAICDLRQEVNSGGFDSYFRYWGGDTAEMALAALPDVLGPKWAAVLRDAMEVLGPSYPIDPDIRAGLIDEGHLGDKLNALDAHFFELEGLTEADSLLSAYLAAHS